LSTFTLCARIAGHENLMKGYNHGKQPARPLPGRVCEAPMQIRPRRSVLYMPGSNARALDKAKSLPADALILDLEDAVAPEAKEAARKQVCDAVKGRGYGQRELVIRI